MTGGSEGVPEGRAPGLDLHRQSSTTDDGPGDLPDRDGGSCPNRRDWLLLNLETGELVPARCGRNGCGYCLPLNARRRALAVAMMRPARTITLTNVAEADDPDPFPVARRRYNRVRELLLRASVDPGAWGVFVERGERTGMVHAHVAQYGPDKIPKGVLQEAAHRSGCGWSRVESVRDPGDLTAYGLKSFGVSAYGLKTFDQADDEGGAGALSALRLNGGRLGHFSRGFFRSADGAKLGVRQAERAAADLARRGEGGRWALVRRATL